MRNELRDNISSLFQGQGQSSGGIFVSNNDGLFFTEFCNYPVRHYKKTTIPERPNTKATASIDSKIAEQLNDEWNQNYGDIYSLYELNWGDEYPNNNDEGWNIVRVYCGGMDDEFIQTNTIFPYKVGLKKTEWGNYYTVEQAVNEAYEFYTTNPKSGFSDRHRKGNSNSIWNDIYECCNNNEFYTIVEKKNRWIAEKPIYIPKNKSYDEARRVSPYENGWMHNGFYRVYIAATQERVFGLEEKEWAISANRNKLLSLWSIGISLLFFAFIIPLSIKEYRYNKKKSETLYQRLIRLSNPKNFMDNYDKDKVEKANLLYKSLLEITPDDSEAINVIQHKAIRDLGISLIDKEILCELKNKVNPQKYMSPYNPDKVALANELYAILCKDGLTYNEMVEVEERAKQL
jgi:hypothetical protein